MNMNRMFVFKFSEESTPRQRQGKISTATLGEVVGFELTEMV